MYLIHTGSEPHHTAPRCAVTQRPETPYTVRTCTKVEWRRKKGYTYQVDRLETQQYIQDVFERADNTISVSVHQATLTLLLPRVVCAANVHKTGRSTD